MRNVIAAVLVAAGVLVPSVSAQDEPAPDPLYWTFAEASLALRDSDWAADRKVSFASCSGRGAYVTRFNYPHFKTFIRISRHSAARCELEGEPGRPCDADNGGPGAVPAHEPDESAQGVSPPLS